MITLEHCRSCGEPIYMLHHVRTGNAAPIEAKASDDGNIILMLETGQYAIVPKELRAGSTQLHVNHYAACPQANKWHQYGKGVKR